MATFRQHYQMISALTFVVGVVLITIGEMAARFDWTRAFGAAAITLGALGVGIYVGLAQPGRWVAVRERLSAAKQPIGVVVLLLVFLPALVALVFGMVGLIDNPDGTGWVIVTGAVVLALMLAATAAAFAVGVAALMGAGAITDEERP